MNSARGSSTERRVAECVFVNEDGVMKPVESDAKTSFRSQYEDLLPPKKPVQASSATFSRLYLTKTREEGIILPKNTRNGGGGGGSNGRSPDLMPIQKKDKTIAGRRHQAIIDEEESHRPHYAKLSATKRDELLNRLAKHPKRLPHPPQHTATTVVLGNIKERNAPKYNPYQDEHLALYWARQKVLSEMREEDKMKRKQHGAGSGKAAVDAKKKRKQPKPDEEGEETKRAEKMPNTASGDTEGQEDDSKEQGSTYTKGNGVKTGKAGAPKRTETNKKAKASPKAASKTEQDGTAEKEQKPEEEPSRVEEEDEAPAASSPPQDDNDPPAQEAEPSPTKSDADYSDSSYIYSDSSYNTTPAQSPQKEGRPAAAERDADETPTRQDDKKSDNDDDSPAASPIKKENDEEPEAPSSPPPAADAKEEEPAQTSQPQEEEQHQDTANDDATTAAAAADEPSPAKSDAYDDDDFEPMSPEKTEDNIEKDTS